MIRCCRYNRRLALVGIALAVWLLPMGGRGVVIAKDGADHAEHSSADEEKGTDDSDSPNSGVELGEYRIRAYYPVETKRSTVTFTLHAIVSSENLAEFERLLEHRRQKVRDQVIVATRLAPLADFDDPDLKQFRRRILLRLHRALPELAIDDIYVSDFQIEIRDI
jgi:hypothetical protein